MVSKSIAPETELHFSCGADTGHVAPTPAPLWKALRTCFGLAWLTQGNFPSAPMANRAEHAVMKRYPFGYVFAPPEGDNTAALLDCLRLAHASQC